MVSKILGFYKIKEKLNIFKKFATNQLRMLSILDNRGILCILIRFYHLIVMIMGLPVSQGTPTQPNSINVFLKTVVDGRTYFRETTLIPRAREAQQNPCNSLCTGFDTIAEAISRMNKEKPKVVGHNILKGLGAMVPVLGPKILAAENCRVAHYVDQIMKDTYVMGKPEAIGVAVDGEVVYVLDAHKVDMFSKATAKLDDEDRLRILVDNILHLLIQEGRKERLRPVKDILAVHMARLDRASDTLVHLDEMEARLQKIGVHKEHLFDEDVVRLIKIAQGIKSIAQDVLRFRKAVNGARAGLNGRLKALLFLLFGKEGLGKSSLPAFRRSIFSSMVPLEM